MRLVVEVQYALGWTDYEFALSLGVHDASDFDHVADVDAAHVAVKDGPKLFGADQEQNHVSCVCDRLQLLEELLA